MKSLILTLMALFIAGSALAESGFATYYTKESCQKEGTSGVFTAMGEVFNENALTCALRSRRFGAFWAVYGTKTGKTVVVRHNDYGPGKRAKNRGVIIDLTPVAFKEVCGDLKQGKCEVAIQKIEE